MPKENKKETPTIERVHPAAMEDDILICLYEIHKAGLDHSRIDDLVEHYCKKIGITPDAWGYATSQNGSPPWVRYNVIRCYRRLVQQALAVKDKPSYYSLTIKGKDTAKSLIAVRKKKMALAKASKIEAKKQEVKDENQALQRALGFIREKDLVKEFVIYASKHRL